MSARTDALVRSPALEGLSAPDESVRGWLVALVWLTTAVSSIVFIEPAPYDFLAVGSVGVALIAGLRVPRSIALPGLLLIVFLLGNWIASLMSSDPLETLRSLTIRAYLSASWLLFACVVAAAPARMLRALWYGYAIAGLIAVPWGALQYLGWIESPLQFRAQGAFKEPNVFGPFLVPIALYALESVWRGRGAARRGWSVLFLIFASGVLISFSRGAWINLIVSVGVYLFLKIVTSRSLRERKRLLATGMTLLAATVGFLTWAATSTALGERLVERAHVQEYDVAQGGRFDTQARTLQSIATRPLGIGPGQSKQMLGLEPHNLYMHVISEGGWIAAFGFYAFLALSLAKGAALARPAFAYAGQVHIVFAALLGTLAQSFFIDSTHWRHLYLLLAVLWGLAAVHAREPRGASRG